MKRPAAAGAPVAAARPHTRAVAAAAAQRLDHTDIDKFEVENKDNKIIIKIPKTK
jgi:hypothetical protein